MIFSIQKNNQGFSLLELLIYITILSSLLIIIVNLFFMISANSAAQDAKIEVQHNLQFALNKITSQMSNYDSDISIMTPANSGETSNILEVLRDGSNIKYDVSAGVLRETIDGTTENITSNNVTVDLTNPIFKRINDTLQINLKISYNDNERPSYKYSSDIRTTISVKK
ncbi:prepilin-type N-terminal cleavage/methylation domain-containing protein [Patescibacteria group bacterium]|nr:prepilin-type N-terminal cleavage/methylation domain-containing protein [Patescibacteria group bacterium]